MIRGSKSKTDPTQRYIGDYENLLIVSRSDIFETLVRAYTLNSFGNPVKYKHVLYGFTGKQAEQTYIGDVLYTHSGFIHGKIYGGTGFTAVNHKCENNYMVLYEYTEELDFKHYTVRLKARNAIVHKSDVLPTEEDKFELCLKYGTMSFVDIEPDPEVVLDRFPPVQPTTKELLEMSELMHLYNMNVLLC